ncbi:MAG: type II secretion system F family protein [Deltaproteobacteria bacterium]|nr:type II secretion system F family protein [Deltaproteobacteria bacterium]
MPLFKYTAMDGDNAVKQGVVEEADKLAASRKLIQQGFRPLEIRPYSAGSKKEFTLPGFLNFQRSKITRTEIDFFTKQIAMLLNAGLSLDGALRVMKNHSQKESFKEFCGSLERKLKEGKSFSQALADYSYFTPMYINITKAGEEGGILPAMLLKISEYQSTFQELKQFIISASVYPVILLIVGIIAIVILITTILPRFEVLFQGMGQQLPPHVAVMMSVAGFVSNHLILTLLLLIGPVALIVWYLKTPEGKKFYHRQSLKVPVLSSFICELETTRIFRTLEVLVNNGVHLATALRICSGIAVNEQFQTLLHRATEALKEGQRVSAKLKGEALLPALAVDLLSIGEESGRVGEVCGQIADHYDQELRGRIKRLISLIEPAFILAIALVAGYVVISMLTVILSINDIAG